MSARDLVAALTHDPTGPSARIRFATVVTVSPLTIALGAGTTPVPSHRHSVCYPAPAVDDVVMVLQQSTYFIALGAVV